MGAFPDLNLLSKSRTIFLTYLSLGRGGVHYCSGVLSSQDKYIILCLNGLPNHYKYLASTRDCFFYYITYGMPTIHRRGQNWPPDWRLRPVLMLHFQTELCNTVFCPAWLEKRPIQCFQLCSISTMANRWHWRVWLGRRPVLHSI
jgi:hypothetical protein